MSLANITATQSVNFYNPNYGDREAEAKRTHFIRVRQSWNNNFFVCLRSFVSLKGVDGGVGRIFILFIPTIKLTIKISPDGDTKPETTVGLCDTCYLITTGSQQVQRDEKVEAIFGDCKQKGIRNYYNNCNMLSQRYRPFMICHRRSINKESAESFRIRLHHSLGNRYIISSPPPLSEII